ncbi:MULTISPECIES: glycosyltransferase family 2 protein [Sphingobacterium]|uniref:glycosyltransferase family 2 protein n=1 Tax=Sphingobacterium TaxID=28453 RepID=UPI0013D99918|nr:MULTISPECIES: glycosyltransferase [unclassified Sphingobacterium]
MKRVLTIIVTYNFEPWLDKCIQSVLGSSYPTDILVLDNCSKDNTVNLLEEKYPTITIVKNKTNLGFGCANNIGLKKVITERYDFAFLVNQDAWIDKYCLERLINGYTPALGIISPMHFDGTGNNLDEGFKNYIKNSQRTIDGEITPFINAAFWLVPTQTIKRVGYFSPIFYHYGEDKDYANRINYHNLKTAYVENALAYHDRQNRIMNADNLFKSEFVFYLTEYCNINYNFITAFTLSIGGIGKKLIKAFISKDNESTKSYLSIAWRIFCLTSKVIKTRIDNKATQKL